VVCAGSNSGNVRFARYGRPLGLEGFIKQAVRILAKLDGVAVRIVVKIEIGVLEEVEIKR